MRRNVLQALVGVDIVLALLLVVVWLVLPAVRSQHAHWMPPSPLRPELASLVPADGAFGMADAARPIALQDRPVFSPNRRPPPPASAASPQAAPPPPDPLADIRLYGVFKSAGASGIMVSVDGKPRRVLLNQNLGPWMLKAVDNRDVTFVRGDETRVVALVKPRTAPAAPAASVAAGTAPQPASPPPVSTVDVEEQNRAQAREQVRRINAVRARAGVPPLPE